MKKLTKFVISAAIATSVIAAASSAQALTLKPGQRSSDVATIQSELKNRGYFPKNVSSTGYYGSITKRAVMNFQRANGLRADGIAGPATLRAMGYSGTGGTEPIETAISYGASGVVRVNTGLNVRTGPGTGYKVIGSLEPGQNIRISNEKNGWYNIHPDGENYWVHSRYVQVQ